MGSSAPDGADFGRVGAVGMPDLPGVPSHLSLEEAAELSRFLDARDLRKGLWRTALFFDPLDPDGHDPDRIVRFVTGMKDPELEARPLDEKGRMVAKCGEILTASGHRFHAVLVLEGAAGFDTFQHYDTILVVPTFEAGELADFIIVSQEREDFAGFVARLRRRPPYAGLEVAPYAYRYYDASTHGLDPHVDERTGWSKSGRRVMDEATRRALGPR